MRALEARALDAFPQEEVEGMMHEAWARQYG